MPWETCAVPGCTTTRKDKGVGIFKLPGDYLKPQDEWRNKILDVLRKRKGFDKFLEQVLDGSARICEKHFKDHDVETYTLPHIHPARRRIRAEALPCKNLPPLLPPVKKPQVQITEENKLGAVIVDDKRKKRRKIYEIDPPPLPKRKFRTIGVDTREDVKVKHFCCQVGESFFKQKHKEEALPS